MACLRGRVNDPVHPFHHKVSILWRFWKGYLMANTMKLQMVKCQVGRKNIVEQEWFQPTAPLKTFSLAKLSKYDTCASRDMFILQLTKRKATVYESDCFASRI